MFEIQILQSLTKNELGRQRQEDICEFEISLPTQQVPGQPVLDNETLTQTEAYRATACLHPDLCKSLTSLPLQLPKSDLLFHAMNYEQIPESDGLSCRNRPCLQPPGPLWPCA